MQVVIEKQSVLREYLAKNYENVQVLIKENWMRLDFNKDGHVSIDDIKQSAQELFEFLKSFDYLQAATSIKSSLYQEAIKYMKSEVGSEQRKRVTSGDAIEMDDFSHTRQWKVMTTANQSYVNYQKITDIKVYIKSFSWWRIYIVHS